MKPAKESSISKISPSQAHKELEHLDWLYENTDLTSAKRDAIEAYIFKALEEWSK